jgi:hypothetical protein
MNHGHQERRQNLVELSKAAADNELVCFEIPHIPPNQGQLWNIFGFRTPEHEPAGEDRNKCVRSQALEQVQEASKN